MIRYLYAAVGRCGLVKVGLAVRPAQRERELRRLFVRYGDEMIRMLVIGPLKDFPFRIESDAKMLAGVFSWSRPAYGREWFKGIDFDSLVTELRRYVLAEQATEAERREHMGAQLRRADAYIRNVGPSLWKKMREEALQPEKKA